VCCNSFLRQIAKVKLLWTGVLFSFDRKNLCESLSENCWCVNKHTLNVTSETRIRPKWLIGKDSFWISILKGRESLYPPYWKTMKNFMKPFVNSKTIK
jgi:hypothetical protein